MEILEFRQATGQDLSVLNGLYADMNDKPLMPEAEIAGIWQQIQKIPDYHIYLACISSKAVGTFSLLFIPTMMYPNFHKAAILDAVTILSSCRGKGYGRQMIQEALKISTEAGCYKVTLSSGIQRERAHNFYKSLGFEQHGWSFSHRLTVAV